MRSAAWTQVAHWLEDSTSHGVEGGGGGGAAGLGGCVLDVFHSNGWSTSKRPSVLVVLITNESRLGSAVRSPS